MVIEKQEKIGDFLFRHIGGNHVVIFPHPDVFTNCQILMTGSDVVKYINIRYLHRIVKLIIVHMNAGGTYSTDALDVTIELPSGSSSLGKIFSDILFDEENITDSQITELFGDKYEYEARNWKLTLNSTNTDLIYMALYIQKLGSK